MNKPNRFTICYLSRLGALSLLTIGLVAGAIAAPATAAEATAAPRVSWASDSAGSNYVALGDSYTAGQGAPPYLPGPCLQSKYTSYPAISALLSRYRLAANKACSGADTAAVYAQLAGVSATTRLVTLTVGGIDAGSSDVLAACAPNPAAPSCLEALAAGPERLAVLGPKLVALYSTIAGNLPNARIAVLNYPRLFKPGVSPLGNQVNSAIDALNSVIRGAVSYAANPRVVFVDVTQEFTNHGIGSAVPYISYNPANLAAPANFHPNALGNVLGYYQALQNDGLLRLTSPVS